MVVKHAFAVAFFLVLTGPKGLAAQGGSQSSLQTRYRPTTERIIAAALSDSAAFTRLGEMVDTYGHRLSGSESLERAIDWVLARMKTDGLDNPHTEPVMVPHWVRGEESAELIEPRRARLPMLGLGGSVGTPAGGITAEVMVATSFDDLTAHGAEARGKIVLFDVPFTTYGQTVQYRVNGAVAAARVGAVASLIRSVASYSIRSPHTGVMFYDSTVARIPHAAIAAEDASMLHRMIARGQKVVVHLAMNAQTLPDAPSRNVMAEIRGTARPNEVVVLGGHMDSWDVGQGAMDDGGGVVVAWQAVRLLKQLGLTPRRTIRVVGWTNEENGGRGGEAYRDAHKSEPHVAAMETDGGVFRPLGYGFQGSDSALTVVRTIAGLLSRIGSDSILKGGGGADIEPLMDNGVPGLGLNVDGTRYFWFHHSDGDTLDKLDPREMNLCVATLAVMAYVIADMPDPLPR
ncbi:MAG: M28 family metallopeptidase [Gemmatimonadota bacterium]